MALCARVVYITLSEYLVPRKYLNNKTLFNILAAFFPPTSNVERDDVNEVSWFSLWSVFIYRLIFHEALALVPLLHRGVSLHGRAACCEWEPAALMRHSPVQPRRPTLLVRANHHHNLLVAIFDYST